MRSPERDRAGGFWHPCPRRTGQAQLGVANAIAHPPPGSARAQEYSCPLPWAEAIAARSAQPGRKPEEYRQLLVSCPDWTFSQHAADSSLSSERTRASTARCSGVTPHTNGPPTSSTPKSGGLRIASVASLRGYRASYPLVEWTPSRETAP